MIKGSYVKIQISKICNKTVYMGFFTDTLNNNIQGWSNN